MERRLALHLGPAPAEAGAGSLMQVREVRSTLRLKILVILFCMLRVVSDPGCGFRVWGLGSKIYDLG